MYDGRVSGSYVPNVSTPRCPDCGACRTCGSPRPAYPLYTITWVSQPAVDPLAPYYVANG
jgi:hypothetical protein